ncbi:helix-turn-helix domain-containing protein, partial [Turicibacter sanguinis]|uniref:helix-turn-helix domain-containing protein n=1 Tax=Turicibacter sanguinis TaxID=154288 RepID=UPI00399961C1
NLTHRVFAERIGLARASVSTIESGRAPAGPRTINDICEKFQINKQWLLTGEGKKHAEDETNELACLIGRFAAENDEFTKRVITEMLKLDAHGWDVIHQLVHNIANKKD